MATKPDISGHLKRELSVAQQNAIDLLVGGATDREAAEKVGVTRQTVNTWRNHDVVFITQLNARRLEIWGASLDKLRSLLPEALNTLEGAIMVSRDPKIALQIIHLAGLDRIGEGIPNLGPYTIGPTNPLTFVDAEARRRRRTGDPLTDLLDHGPISDSERLAVLKEWEEMMDQ